MERKRMKKIKMLAVVLAGLMVGSNAMCAATELETPKVSCISNLYENLGNRDVFGSIYGTISVVWNAREVAGAVKTDILSGTAFAHLASGAKEARKSDCSILSYPAFFCDHGLTVVGATYNVVTHPAQTMADAKEYAFQFAYAEWLVVTDSKIVKGLNDLTAVERLLDKKTD
jgi:hypothetical protein